jgi:hypothetical protein
MMNTAEAIFSEKQHPFETISLPADTVADCMNESAVITECQLKENRDFWNIGLQFLREQT